MINNPEIKNTYNKCASTDEARIAYYVATLAIKALMYELAATPKPGLVDRHNNGAHDDMDYFTFINSAYALVPYFRDITLMGLHHGGCYNELFDNARKRGIEAENEMLHATNGVNTHKGAIFSLGLCCLGVGVIISNGEALTSKALLNCTAKIAVGITTDFESITKNTTPTHGEELYIKHGLKGIRGEAAEGFPSIANVSLPVLVDMLNCGLSGNDASVVTLMHLLAAVEDTNIAHRSSIETQQTIMTEQQALLKTNPSNEELLRRAYELDKLFIEKNISPGGCADLLALTWLVYFLCYELNI